MSKKEQKDKTWKDRKHGKFPPVTFDERPSDYDDDLHRGTIEFNPNWFNYSYHNVIIPAGTVVREANFTQCEPKTDCITVEGQGTITFIDCNLGNVKLDPSWILERCNTVQSYLVEKDRFGIIREARHYVCRHPDELDPNHEKPPNRITRKD